MNDDMRFGYLLAMQGVKEEIRAILSELKSKGHDEPLGFSTLIRFVQDCINDIKQASVQQQLDDINRRNS